MRGDRNFVLAVVRQDGLALEYMSEGLRSNRDVVLAALTYNGHALRHASEGMQNNEDIVLAAVTQDGRAVQTLGSPCLTRTWRIACNKSDPDRRSLVLPIHMSANFDQFKGTLAAGMRHNPMKLGFAFHLDEDGETSFQLAIRTSVFIF